MKIKRTLAIAVAFSMLCIGCDQKTDPEKPDPKPEPDPKPQTEEINGTKIQEGMTAVGLIKNASTGKGIAGVPVTDGYTYVVTDANGVYQMAANRFCRKIYMSVPSEYEIPLDPSSHMPLIYSSDNYDKSKVNRNDFTLEPLQAPENSFTLLMIGDPQCQTESEATRYKTETIPDMQKTLNTFNPQGKYLNPYGITLGDVTFDSYDMWGTMKNSMSNVKLQTGGYLPIFQCIGNHDHNSLAQNSDYEATGAFVETFGPTDYSFNRGQAHIIVMDDIMVTNVNSNSSPNRYTWSYNGGFTKAQYEWLKQDLSYVENKSDKLVFLCLHIPFRGGSKSGGSNVNKEDAYYKEVLTLLRDFKEAHIMIGHTHYPQNYRHSSYRCKGGNPIYEHIHGAACGGWWSCNSNVTGAPNGYSLYEIEGNTVKNWVAKGTKTDMDYQIRVYDGNQIYSGSKGYQYCWHTNNLNGTTINIGGSGSYAAKYSANTKNCFVAEIWDDDEANWTVEMFKDGNKLGSFTRIADGGSCNIAITSYFFNELGKNSDTWTNSTASHYWYFKPEGVLPADLTGWTVKATQKIPGTSTVNEYYCTGLTTDYSDF